MKRSWLPLVVMAALGMGACGSSAATLPDGGGAALALDCPSYCRAIQAACTAADLQYGDQGTCEVACPAFPVGASGDKAGDTLGCRVHEAALAAAGPAQAAVHCRRAGPGGDGTCGENCDGYCDLAMTFCTADKNAQIYADRAACLTDCRAHGTSDPYRTGGPDETNMGNQVACLLYHGVQASVFPGLHCLTHLAPTASVCKD